LPETVSVDAYVLCVLVQRQFDRVINQHQREAVKIAVLQRELIES
jgi:hypothetical protein